MRSTLFLVVFLLAAGAFSSLIAQDCKPPVIVANSRTTNMFLPEQEMIVGELVMQRLAKEYRPIKDPKLQKYVDELGARIVQHLPETGLKFSFHIIDFPEANAFNIPGGHVYLTRKLIALAQTEDELAGVIGHELGHAAVHHGAVDLSESMRLILKINSLGDRKDIVEKYNLYLENYRMKRISRRSNHEDAQQVEADRIGLFASVAAGYDPDGYFAFFDRLTESDGKTGNWFSDLFGKQKPAQKRLREMAQLMKTMAPQCRSSRVQGEAFQQWQADVVMYRDQGRSEVLPGLITKKELQSKLRTDINYLAFSSDGKMLLAQDEYAITIINVPEKRVMFQIPVEGARSASFTPDNRSIILTTAKLRYEKWDIETQKPVEAREVVVRYDCVAFELSPDGKYLACVDAALRPNIIDMKTGAKIWEKEDFYKLSYVEYLYFSGIFGSDFDLKKDFFKVQFSPDSRYVVFSRSMTARTTTMGGNAVAAVELPSLKRIDLGGDLRTVTARGYTFLDSGRIAGQVSRNLKESGVFSFPDGKRLKQFTMGGSSIRKTENSNYVIVKPMVETKLGVFDVEKGTILAGLNKDDVALWGNLIAYESANGKVVIRELTGGKALEGKDIANIDIPVSLVGSFNAAVISNSFGWIALSAKSRGGLWNLTSGERKLLVRGFRGALVADDGGALSHFPAERDTTSAFALLNPVTNQVTPVRDMPKEGVSHFGRFVLVRKSLKEEKPENEPDEEKTVVGGEEIDRSFTPLYRNVRFELKDALRDEVVWSRDYPKFAPYFGFDQASGRLLLQWRVNSEAGKARLEESPELKQKIAALGNKDSDFLVEVIDGFSSGKTIGLLTIETGKGSFGLGLGKSSGNWVVFYDSFDRVLVYSMDKGELKHRYFGQYAIINPKRNQLVLENFPGDIVVYDLESGEETAKIILNGEAALIRFNLEGDKMFILTKSQTAYTIDMNKIAAAGPQSR